MLKLAFEGVYEDNNVFGRAEQDELAIWTKLHLLDLRIPLLVIDREDREGSFLVILRVEEMHLLDSSASTTRSSRAWSVSIFEV